MIKYKKYYFDDLANIEMAKNFRFKHLNLLDNLIKNSYFKRTRIKLKFIKAGIIRNEYNKIKNKYVVSKSKS